MTRNLIEDLQFDLRFIAGLAFFYSRPEWRQTLNDAAAQLAALEQENARLREAAG
jgi:hypothetical protein